MPLPIPDETLRQYARDAAELIDSGYPPYEDVAATKSRAAHGQPSLRSALAAKWGIGAKAAGDRLHRIRNGPHASIMSDAVERYNARKAATPRDTNPRQIDLIVEEHSLRTDLRKARAQIAELADALKKQGAIADALGELSEPLEPVTFQRTKAGARQAETVILFLSDLQWGETVNLGAMDGLNSYSPEIARNRLKRTFEVAAELMTDHWPASAPPPERLILILGGDMISGDIHEELSKTNSLATIPALKDCASHIIAGIRLLYETVGGPVDIISVPGNHGRLTRKPESKGYAEHSYDTLLADLVEMEFRQDGKWPSWFRIFKPMSGDALIWIYGYRFLITHGDRIGSRGGTGFVGPAATVARGFKRLVADYAGRGVTLDYVLCGHFHTALELEEGICNGTLVGPSEYSRDFRYRPKPACQAFIAVHPRYGITQCRWIKPGDESEGSLYAAKALPPDGGKMRYRIPAIGR